MMLIDCPHCGARQENEFRYGGVSPLVRPPLDCEDEAWARYLFFRENPSGGTMERWCHDFGCGEWFVVRRDTATHRFQADVDEAACGADGTAA